MKRACACSAVRCSIQRVYGILVVRAATEDEARELGNGDPSVMAGMIKIEVAEMRWRLCRCILRQLEVNEWPETSFLSPARWACAQNSVRNPRLAPWATVFRR